MQLDHLSALGFVVVVAASFGAATIFQRRQFARLRAQLQGDPDVEVVDAGRFGGFAVCPRPPRRAGRLSVRSANDVDSNLHWEFTTDTQRVWQRTTLKVLSAPGITGRLHPFEGLNVEIDDAALRERVRLGGVHPDVVRGLFRVPAVRDGAIALVDTHGLKRFTLDSRGQVLATLSYDGARNVDVKAMLLALVAFVDALDAAVDAPEVPAPGSCPPLLDAAGSASGAPVGVPGGLIQRPR
jgi:hypothetical protein